MKVGSRVRGGARFQDTLRLPEYVAGGWTRQCFSLACRGSCRGGEEICMGFCVWVFWRRSGRAEPYNRIYTCMFRLFIFRLYAVTRVNT